MPAHKNQHFVPRCALKPFSLNGEGKAINVFNIAASREIKNAPVKGQCAHDYLYGKDLTAEMLLAKLEGHYARIVDILSDGGVLPKDDVSALKLLILVQMRRTEAAVEQIKQFQRSMDDKAYAGAPEQRPADNRSDTDLILMSMRMAGRARAHADDLKLVVFRNKTKVDFVTSDNPAHLTNRFYLEKYKGQKFGISNAGAILMMPLTPRLSVACYDSDVYSVANGSGTQFVDLTNEEDVSAVNQLQYLSASKNIYFSNWSDVERIARDMDALKEARSRLGPTSRVYIRDDNATGVALTHRDPKSGKVEKYRLGTEEEEKTAKETIIGTSFETPDPGKWPSKLKLRDKPKYFPTGTAAGNIRRAEVMRRMANVAVPPQMQPLSLNATL